MTTVQAADNNNNKQHQRRKELKDKVGRLASSMSAALRIAPA